MSCVCELMSFECLLDYACGHTSTEDSTLLLEFLSAIEKRCHYYSILVDWSTLNVGTTTLGIIIDMCCRYNSFTLGC